MTTPSTKESFIITLPLPPSILSPNRPTGSIGGRMRRAKATERYRKLARRAAEAEMVESGPWQKATVKAAFYHGVDRRRDDVNHNAMLKPAYDGVVDAGVLVDDDHKHLTTLPAEFRIDRDCPRVELLFERVDA